MLPPLAINYRALAKDSYEAPDGCPFWLTLIAEEDGIVSPLWGLRFSSRQGARDALCALVQLGFISSGFVSEDIDYVYRDRQSERISTLTKVDVVA